MIRDEFDIADKTALCIEFPTDFEMMQIQEPGQDTILFRNIPPRILARDDDLRKFAEIVLSQFNPVHFNIDDDTLIATFKTDITYEELQVLCFILANFSVFFILSICNFGQWQTQTPQ